MPTPTPQFNQYWKFGQQSMPGGACSLGHNRADIRRAMEKVFDIGIFAEFDHPLTGQLAEKITTHFPCAERVRFVNSGSEATLHDAQGLLSQAAIETVAEMN